MKYILPTLLLSFFNIAAFGSCLLKIEGNQEGYGVVSWKHTDGEDDKVTAKDYTKEQLQEISYYLNQSKVLKMIFNDGVFTSMQYHGGSTRKWANLTSGERDMITYIQKKFDVGEHR